MIDYELTDIGDIHFEPAVIYPDFKIDFTTNTYNTLCLQFDIRQEYIPVHKNNAFCISFVTSNTPQKQYCDAHILEQLDELMQAIRIQFKTELGEITDRDTLGSNLILTKHLDIRDKTTIDKIEMYASSALADLFYNTYTVKAIAEKGNDTDNFYCQHVSIYVYDADGTEIYYYSL
jgi:hypothetical protein